MANWPSLAVGVLKAHLAQRGVLVDGFHLHFEVAIRLGLSRYSEIAEGWELGEAIYFALHAPDEAAPMLDRTATILRGRGQAELARWASTSALAEVERATSEALEQVPLSEYDVVGLSVGALQLGASVYLAHELKRRAPHLRVVIGGTSVLGAPGATLLSKLPFVDAVVDGEGEQALDDLVAATEWSEAELAAIPNLMYRKSDGTIARSATSTKRNLDDAAPPDMDEYYAAARSAGYPRSGLVLPIEASRGCAWEHRIGDGQLHGCTFCGLYRNSPNYREKGLDVVMESLRANVERTQVLDVSFVDAYLPSGYSKDLLREIANADLDLTLFCEMRCDLDEEMAQLMCLAGVRRVQLGVESFNTRVLAKMSKGTRMIDNVSSIKLCEEFGVPFQYNLITRFPGIRPHHLVAMAELLPWLRGFTPPTTAEFYLDRSSRIFAAPRRFGIDPDSLDRDELPFLPSALARDPVTQFVSYRSTDNADVDDAWRRIADGIAAWQRRFSDVRAMGIRHVLSYRHAGERLLIEDWREEDAVTMELEGCLRDVLLECDRLTDRESLEDALPDLSSDMIDEVLAELRAHRLIVEEGTCILGLPIRARLPSGITRGWLTDGS